MASKFFTAASALLFVAFAGCSESPVTTFNRDSDCKDICKRYSDCVGGGYDEDGCNSRCTDMTSKASTQNIDDCETCLDGTSCVSGAFKCLTECGSIVP
jgi:hypothetical protein